MWKLWLDFLQALLVAAMWPLVVLGMFFYLRNEIKLFLAIFAKKLDSLRSLKVPGASADFVQNLDDVRAIEKSFPDDSTSEVKD